MIYTFGKKVNPEKIITVHIFSSFNFNPKERERVHQNKCLSNVVVAVVVVVERPGEDENRS